MKAEEFRAKVENGEIPLDYDQVLRIAYIYMDEGLWNGNGVFDVVEELHTRGWSFGRGDLQFNRTLDIFYLAQIAAGIYRSSDQTDGDFPLADDFDAFYTQHHELLNQNAWKQYYSAAFLAQSARFYRLPDLRDLPDSSDPLTAPRQKGIGHFTKLPRWAANVSRTQRRQPAPVETVTHLALSTLQHTISCLRKDYPSVQPYSETQARFWLRRMGIDSPYTYSREAWRPSPFGVQLAQGAFDVWEWEAHYSPERWHSIEARIAPLEPDLDGTRKREDEVHWCGMPDGGVGAQAWWRGWEPELGSEEEIEFLAAIAAKETEGICLDVGNLDYSMQSHMLLGVMRAAFDREKSMEDIKRRIVEAGRIDENNRAEQWIQEVLKVMEPYVQKRNNIWPATEEERNELLRRILVENGQLFARWKYSPPSKEFSFELKPRKYM